MQNTRRDIKKAETARKTRGTVVIDIRDLGFTATVELKGDRIEVRNGKPEELSDCALISANFGVISYLFGNNSTIKSLKFMLSGKLKIKKILLAKKLSTIMSTR
ncbi:MAG: hypothetical protein HA489_04605 [Archaeoglobales archaeon]|nr:hypothetical protein [Archaeoglobales archaeon]